MVGQELPFLRQQITCEIVKHDICHFTNEVNVVAFNTKYYMKKLGFFFHMNKLLEYESVLKEKESRERPCVLCVSKMPRHQ